MNQRFIKGLRDKPGSPCPKWARDLIFQAMQRLGTAGELCDRLENSAEGVKHSMEFGVVPTITVTDTTNVIFKYGEGPMQYITVRRQEDGSIQVMGCEPITVRPTASNVVVIR